MINSFFFNDNSRIIQEYFQAKIGRKIRILYLEAPPLSSTRNLFIYRKMHSQLNASVSSFISGLFTDQNDTFS